MSYSCDIKISGPEKTVKETVQRLVGDALEEGVLISFTEVKKDARAPGLSKAAKNAKRMDIDERRKKVVKMFKAGKTPAEITEELGLSRGTAYNDLRATGTV